MSWKTAGKTPALRKSAVPSRTSSTPLDHLFGVGEERHDVVAEAEFVSIRLWPEAMESLVENAVSRIGAGDAERMKAGELMDRNEMNGH